MPCRIEFSPDAERHLLQLKRFDQTKILSSIDAQLRDEPLRPTRNRKPMRSNLIATWELRIGNHRVYYDVDEPENAVLIRAVGVKRHGRVTIGDEEVDLT